ncbi:hypothetical protein HNQ65_004163 [Prosthecobacter vanneervenii]|uniref:Uncharacterized protein n=1 Tax=Prosthecobacter vanneervenii TaxID=48466 RepID=A0A7W7YE84_9BACT|nr:hypothetical protein [Prosthecobacter vanneervenii]
MERVSTFATVILFFLNFYAQDLSYCESVAKNPRFGALFGAFLACES